MTAEIKKLAEFLHLVYCKRAHEYQMELFNSTEKCKFYIENSLENPWLEEEHKEWVMQAQLFISICKPIDAEEVLRDFIMIWKKVEELKKVNQKLMSYVKIILE